MYEKMDNDKVGSEGGSTGGTPTSPSPTIPDSSGEEGDGASVTSHTSHGAAAPCAVLWWYQPAAACNGWLGIMMGTRLWYGFFGDVLKTGWAFGRKLEELMREMKPPPQID